MTLPLRQTPLFDLHVKRDAKMVPFAGYEMPLQYPTGIMAEHLHCRAAAGLFDVSHMGQAVLAGAQAVDVLEQLTPSDIAGLAEGQMRYTVLLNDCGGIVDDLMVTRLAADQFFVVVNAACKDKDFSLLQAAGLRVLEDRALIALQGPKAAAVLGTIWPEVADMAFMTLKNFDWQGAACRVSRSGYTGEDGFEISVLDVHAVALAEALAAHEDVKPVGLGARDSLRLEAGLCLYGQDLDEDTTPVEAGLAWVIQKRRRESAGFAGADKILAQLKDGPARKRVGIKPVGRQPVREGVLLFDDQDKNIGCVTSGGFGPSVDGPVAMGYIDAALAKPGTEIMADLRGRRISCTVVKLPFIERKKTGV